MISFLWEKWWQLWAKQNKNLRRADAAAGFQAATREVNRTLRNLYDLPDRFDVPISTIFFPNENDVAEQPNRGKSKLNRDSRTTHSRQK